MKLLKKEFSLCLHPAAVVFLGLSTLVLIPNYPPAISFFYVTLGIFFICMAGRENHDVAFTLTLPVSRQDAVAGRVLLACCLEILQVVLCGLLAFVKARVIGLPENPSGMDANLALPGEGLLLFGLFNLVFFPAWYKDIRKVGVPFLMASAAVFVYIVAAVVATYALPFVRDQLDTPDPAFLTAKALFLLFAFVFYAGATFLAFRLSVRRFEKQDLQL
ncbi:MAG: ABC-2 transporter permease [Clostridia bacterium]|nr:ABC-2 transporter permease [Clostridia bacterium]